MTILRVSDLVVKIGFVDPAGGKTRAQALKRTRARSAIVIVGMDALTRVFVLHAWAARCSTTTLLEEMYRVAGVWHPRPFFVEANAMQSLFVDCAAYIAARFNRQRVAFTPYYQPTHLEKDFRNRTVLQPIISQGRLFLRREHHELQAELKVHPRAPVKDLVDALGSCCANLPRVAGIRGTRTAEAEGLAAYLRERGASPAEIAHRMAELATH